MFDVIGILPTNPYILGIWHALFPNLGESQIPQSSTSLRWGCYDSISPTVVFPTFLWSTLIDSCWSTVSYFVLAPLLPMPCVWLETPLGPSLVLAPRTVIFCDGSLDDSSSNNLPNPLCQVSNNTWIGLVCHGILANGILCPFPLFFLVAHCLWQLHELQNYRFASV